MAFDGFLRKAFAGALVRPPEEMIGHALAHAVLSGGYPEMLHIENEAAGLVGIEVKAAATVNAGDFKGLRKLADAARDNLKLGIVLYDGDSTVPFGDRMFAAPVPCLWG